MTQHPIKSPKKLIEVALPLDAINVASIRESISATATHHAASVVGAAAVGGGARRDLCATGQ